MRYRRSVAAAMTCVALAACSSGKSILQAGNEPPPATTTTPKTAPGPPASTIPGQTLPPTTPPTIATTTTTPLATLPPCPVDALDDATDPVEITLWYGLSGTLEGVLTDLTDEYNASQDKVRVNIENQGGYNDVIDKFVQSRESGRPDLAIFPEYTVQQFADSGSVIPMGACIESDGFDTKPLVPRALLAYETAGVQWGMPFNVSNPVLYYNRKMFEAAGLDPGEPPVTLQQLRATSQALVDSGAAATGIALDSGVDSGGGWFLEQWFARAGEPYADNGNGRRAPATRVLYDGPFGIELMTYAQSLINDGLAVSVGDNPQGQDALLKLADPDNPAAMAIATSAALGTVLSALDGGLIPGITSADVGVGAMPGPGETPSATVGGGALYITEGKGDAEAAAAWDFTKFLVSAEAQSKWAAASGYAPVNKGALELDPLRSTYRDDPRFKVSYEQVVAGTDDFAAVGPVLGPQREVRAATADAVAAIFNGADVASSLSDAAAQSNALIADYNARN
jgi:sn-glycerol 3-phosphate transport system substrate-binding protein